MNIERISRSIANYVIPSCLNDKNHLEVVTYGVGAILTSVINIGVAIIVHIMLGRYIELLKILLFFLPLRLIHKGYHCRTFLKCLMTTNLLFFIITYLSVELVIDRNVMFVMFVIILLLQLLLSYEHNIKILFVYLLLYFLSLMLNTQLEMFMLSALIGNTILIMGRRFKDDFSYKRIST